MLASHPLWNGEASRDAVSRRLTFRDFVTAFSFMAAVALLAEQQGHHPEWSNIRGRVRIILTTDEAGGLTARDATPMLAIDQAAIAFGVYG